MLADNIQQLLLNPHVEELYDSFLFHPDVRITRSMGILCLRITFSVRPEADPFIILPKMYGMKRKDFFSSMIGSGVGGGKGGGRSKSGKYTGGGVVLFETRVESNLDVYDGLRYTLPYIDHHHNMVKWELPKGGQKGVQNFVAAKMFAMKLKSKAKKLVALAEEKKVQEAKAMLQQQEEGGGDQLTMLNLTKQAQQHEQEEQSQQPKTKHQ